MLSLTGENKFWNDLDDLTETTQHLLDASLEKNGIEIVWVF